MFAFLDCWVERLMFVGCLDCFCVLTGFGLC